MYSTLVAHLSVWHCNRNGAVEVVSPLRNLAAATPRPGLLAVTAVLLGSTAFDSFAGSTTWLQYTQSTSLNVTIVESLLLLGVCVLVGGMFWVAAAAPSGSANVPVRQVPGLLAHSMVPIIVGYMVAHYLTLLVETGQQTLIQASDPLGNGMNCSGLPIDRSISGCPCIPPSWPA